jgi:maltose alpha-D-glucosyltransferase/alpha-amylase
LFRKPNGKRPPHDPYGFSFFDRAGHGNILEFLDEYLPNLNKTQGQGFIAIPTGNHDINPRISAGRDQADLELVYQFLLTMPGTPFIYYGDEIGLRTLDGLPSKEGGYHRTGSRTPMQWDDTANAGFSTAAPEQLYLPVDSRPDRPTVAHQTADAHSLLNTVRNASSSSTTRIVLF